MDQQTAIFLFWATVVVSVISNSYALFRLYHDGKYSYLIFVAISNNICFHCPSCIYHHVCI